MSDTTDTTDSSSWSDYPNGISSRGNQLGEAETQAEISQYWHEDDSDSSSWDSDPPYIQSLPSASSSDEAYDEVENNPAHHGSQEASKKPATVEELIVRKNSESSGMEDVGTDEESDFSQKWYSRTGPHSWDSFLQINVESSDEFWDNFKAHGGPGSDWWAIHDKPLRNKVMKIFGLAGLQDLADLATNRERATIEQNNQTTHVEVMVMLEQWFTCRTPLHILWEGIETTLPTQAETSGSVDSIIKGHLKHLSEVDSSTDIRALIDSIYGGLTELSESGEERTRKAELRVIEDSLKQKQKWGHGTPDVSLYSSLSSGSFDAKRYIEDPTSDLDDSADIITDRKLEDTRDPLTGMIIDSKIRRFLETSIWAEGEQVKKDILGRKLALLNGETSLYWDEDIAPLIVVNKMLIAYLEAYLELLDESVSPKRFPSATEIIKQRIGLLTDEKRCGVMSSYALPGLRHFPKLADAQCERIMNGVDVKIIEYLEGIPSTDLDLLQLIDQKLVVLKGNYTERSVPFETFPAKLKNLNFKVVQFLKTLTRDDQPWDIENHQKLKVVLLRMALLTGGSVPRLLNDWGDSDRPSSSDGSEMSDIQRTLLEEESQLTSRIRSTSLSSDYTSSSSIQQAKMDGRSSHHEVAVVPSLNELTSPALATGRASPSSESPLDEEGLQDLENELLNAKSDEEENTQEARNSPNFNPTLPRTPTSLYGGPSSPDHIKAANEVNLAELPDVLIESPDETLHFLSEVEDLVKKTRIKAFFAPKYRGTIAQTTQPETTERATLARARTLAQTAASHKFKPSESWIEMIEFLREQRKDLAVAYSLDQPLTINWAEPIPGVPCFCGRTLLDQLISHKIPSRGWSRIYDHLLKQNESIEKRYIVYRGTLPLIVTWAPATEGEETFLLKDLNDPQDWPAWPERPKALSTEEKWNRVKEELISKRESSYMRKRRTDRLSLTWVEDEHFREDDAFFTIDELPETVAWLKQYDWEKIKKSLDREHKKQSYAPDAECRLAWRIWSDGLDNEPFLPKFTLEDIYSPQWKADYSDMTLGQTWDLIKENLIESRKVLQVPDDHPLSLIWGDGEPTLTYEDIPETVEWIDQKDWNKIKTYLREEGQNIWEEHEKPMSIVWGNNYPLNFPEMPGFTAQSLETLPWKSHSEKPKKRLTRARAAAGPKKSPSTKAFVPTPTLKSDTDSDSESAQLPSKIWNKRSKTFSQKMTQLDTKRSQAHVLKEQERREGKKRKRAEKKEGEEDPTKHWVGGTGRPKKPRVVLEAVSMKSTVKPSEKKRKRSGK